MSGFSVLEDVAHVAVPAAVHAFEASDNKLAMELVDLGSRLFRTFYGNSESIASIASNPMYMRAEGAELQAATEISETAAKRIATWYPELPPQLGTYLTDPNVVLTLGDARGQTEFFVSNATPELGKMFSRLNGISREVGLEFDAHLGSKIGDISGLHVDVTSRVGLGRTSAQTRISGIERFDVSDTKISPWQWLNKSIERLPPIPLRGDPEEGRFHMAIGLLKGYPDEAVTALTRAENTNSLVSTRIRFGHRYPSAAPDYHYLPEDQLSITRHASRWGTALEQYYNSPEHRAIEQNPGFIRERLSGIEEDLSWLLKNNAPITSRSADSADSFDRQLFEAQAWLDKLSTARSRGDIK